NIRCRPPVPTPISSRPRLNWSRVLRSLARWTGLCRSVTNTQPYPLGAGRRVTHRLQRAHERHRAQRLLQRPGALETERLGPRHVRPEASRIEFTVRNELWDRDRNSHVLAPVSVVQLAPSTSNITLPPR